MTEDFYLLSVSCKICKRPLQVPADRECPTEWLDQLAPMLTCNTCYDNKRRGSEAAESISEATWLLRGLQQQAHTPVGSKNLAALAPQIEQRLTAATKQYARAVAHFLGMEEPFWNTSLVNRLMEHPSQQAEIMAQYKKEIAEYAEAQKQAQLI